MVSEVAKHYHLRHRRDYCSDLTHGRSSHLHLNAPIVTPDVTAAADVDINVTFAAADVVAAVEMFAIAGDAPLLQPQVTENHHNNCKDTTSQSVCSALSHRE